jgi:hypothetical protein
VRMFDRLHKQLDRLLANVSDRQCHCPAEPAETNKVSGDVEISEIREIDVGPVPCPKCRGWRHMVYRMIVISTTQPTHQAANDS